MEIMIEKHPVMCIPYLTYPEFSFFKEYEKGPYVMPVDI